MGVGVNDVYGKAPQTLQRMPHISNSASQIGVFCDIPIPLAGKRIDLVPMASEEGLQPGYDGRNPSGNRI